MSEITMLPAPQQRWVMMCPCGAAEIRAETGPRWSMFTLERLGSDRYRISCRTCGHANEHRTD